MATTETPQVVKAIRKIRHWKQRWDPNAAFVWRKETRWPKPSKSGRTSTRVVFPAGSVLTPWVIESMGKAKLRRFWESHRIELLEFNAPNVATGQAQITPGEETTRPMKVARPKPAKAKKKAARKKASRKKAARKRTARKTMTAAAPPEASPVPLAAHAAD